MKKKCKILIFVCLSFLVWIIILQTQTYHYPSKDEINLRINYLSRVVHQPLNNNSDVVLLGRENPEFMLFTYAYTTYALTNLAVKDSSYNKLACEIIKESICKVLDRKIYSTYGIETSLVYTDSISNYSILYLGHLNLMLGCYRLISSDTTFDKLNNLISSSLYERYSRTSFLNLESYPSSIWVPDNTVAIASLKLHSFNTGSDYDIICKKWVEYAKAKLIDTHSKVLYSTLDPKNGKPVEEPRGSMLGWSIMFIFQFDSQFAIELYENYKKHFSNNYLVFRIFKERYKNTDFNNGDIDSGPIILGYSIPANEFALSNAILSGDYKTARKIQRLISIGAKESNRDNEISCKIRFFNMNISPMAEALILNSLTIIKWTNTKH